MFKKLGKAIGKFVTKDAPEFITKKAPMFVTKDVPEFVTKDVLKFVEEDVKDFITEEVPEFVTEDIPEFVTEDIPEGTKAILGQKKLKEEVEALRETKASLMADLSAARSTFFDLSLRYTEAEAIYRARLEIYSSLPQSHHANTDIDFVEDVNYDRAKSGLDKMGKTASAALEGALSFVTLGLTDLLYKPFDLLEEKEHLRGEIDKLNAALSEIAAAETGLGAGLADINKALTTLDAVLEARGLQFQTNSEDRLRFEQVRATRSEAILNALLAEGISPADARRIVNMPPAPLPAAGA